MFNYEILVILTILFEYIYIYIKHDVLENNFINDMVENDILVFVIKNKQDFFILFLINVGVRANLRVFRLISRVLKLMII
jgi:hypothetical protein